MMQGSIIVSPQVLVDRNRPYSTIKNIDLTSSNSSSTQTFTVPDDILITSMFASVYCQDIDGITYAISEVDSDRDIYTVRVKVVGRTDYSDGNQDIFNFNKQSNGEGFQGFILPRNTDIQLTVAHQSNGTRRNLPVYRFVFEMNGYTVMESKEIRTENFRSR